MFSATIMDVVYGITVTELDDPYVSLAQKATIIFSNIVVPGQYLVELLPFLKHVPSWFPGAGFKRQARQWSKTISAARNTAYDATLDAFVCRFSCSPALSLNGFSGSRGCPSFGGHITCGERHV